MTLFGDEEVDPTYTVSGLALAVNRAVRRAFPDEVWVRGEIRDLARPASGHRYFNLVEAGASDRPGGTVEACISVMLSARVRPRINERLVDAGAGQFDDGTQVRIRGRLDWYAPRGRLQLRMTEVDPSYTLGQLAAERAAVLRSLETDGLLDANSSRPFPLVPLRIGLVTSRGSDAEHDVIHELERSGIGFVVLSFDARVQGVDAPASVATGVAVLDGHVDVIVIARGGGSATDLHAFDAERVARAIALSRTPVITGIGHERDRSVADEVAHSSHKTPTAAAQHLIATVTSAHERAETAWSAISARGMAVLERADTSVRTLGRAVSRAARSATSDQQRRLDHLEQRLRTSAIRRVEHASAQHSATGSRLERSASRLLRDQMARLDRAARAVDETSHRQLRSAERRLAALGTQLRVLDPATTLARGWSITRDADGVLVRSGGDAPPGTRLRTTVADGTIASTVDSAETDS